MKKIYSYSHEFVIPFIPLQKFLINLLILTKFHRRLITSEMLSFCKFQKYRRQVKGGKKTLSQEEKLTTELQWILLRNMKEKLDSKVQIVMLVS